MKLGIEQNKWLVVALGVLKGLEAERGRKQGDAIERDALVGEISRNAGSPRSSVTLAKEKERRAPALVACEIEPDEFAESFDVTFDAEKFLGQLGVGGAAEAGLHGIDEHDIALVQQAMGIVRDAIGRGWQQAIGQHRDPPRSQRAHMKPDGRRPRAAVERESQRTLFNILTVEGVGHEKHLGFDLAVAALDGKASRGRRVFQHLAVYRDLAMRHHRRNFGDVILFFIFVSPGLWRSYLLIFRWRRGLCLLGGLTGFFS